jgi:membrane protein
VSGALVGLLHALPGFFAPIAIVAGLAIDALLFLWTSHVLPNRDVGWRPLLPGAILGAIGLEGLKLLGALYVPRAVASASALYGSLGIVFAVLAWLLFFGRLLIYCEVLNVVLYERTAGTDEAIVEVPHVSNITDEATRSGQAEHVPAR